MPQGNNYNTELEVNNYYEHLCDDNTFLCTNKDFCVKYGLDYSSVEEINDICTNIQKAKECVNDIDECFVTVVNLLDKTTQSVRTGFNNIIIPIPKGYDANGNQKFIRLPKLQSKKLFSKDLCKRCECFNRFAVSPGSGNKKYTAQRNEICQFPKDFEYYFFPEDIEYTSTILSATRRTILDKHDVYHENIIKISTDSELEPVNLKNILISKGISKPVAQQFVNTLYPNSVPGVPGVPGVSGQMSYSKESFGSNNFVNFNLRHMFFIVLFIILILFVYINNNRLKKRK